MTMYLASDKDGFDLKEFLKAELIAADYDVVDLTEEAADDFVDSANLLVQKLNEDEDGRGIAVDAYGSGSFMAANKHKGAVVAQTSDERSAYMTREHNNARMITVGSEILGHELAKNIALEFAKADYDGGRHQVRVDMLNKMA